MAVNIFTAAQKKVKVPKAKEEKISVSVPALKEDIENFIQYKEEMDFLKTKIQDLESKIHETGKKEFAKLFKANHKNPDSFYLAADEDTRLMYLPTDKYHSIDDEQKNFLEKKYGKDVIEEKTAFTFDPDMLQKYGDAISNLIMKSKDISNEDKTKLITATVSYSVKKGTIDRFDEFKTGIKEAIEDFSPVMQIKRSK